MRLSWARLYRQFGVNPSMVGDMRTVNYFRTDYLRELTKIKMAWPDLNYAAASGSLRGSLPLVSETESLLEDSESIFHKTPVIRGSFPR